MNLALYDMTLSGHHGAHLLAIARAARAREWRLSVIVPDRERVHPVACELQKIVGPNEMLFSAYEADTASVRGSFALLRHHFDQRKAALRSFQSLGRQWDFVYTSSLDYMDKAIQLLGSPFYPTRFGGMVMRARFHMDGIGIASGQSMSSKALARIAFGRLLTAKGVACITTADPTLAKYCLTQKTTRFRKVRLVPEIGMLPLRADSESAKTNFGFAEDDAIVLIYGTISHRKAVTECVRAIASQGPASPLKLLVVGKASRAMEEEFQSPEYVRLQDSGRLVVINKFANSHLEDLAFAAADAVWVAYKGHSTMSGVFYQAVCSGRPVVAPNYGVLHWLTTNLGVGISVDPGQPIDVGNRLTALLRGRAGYAGFQENSRKLGALHHPDSFGGKVCDQIAWACQ